MHGSLSVNFMVKSINIAVTSSTILSIWDRSNWGAGMNLSTATAN